MADLKSRLQPTWKKRIKRAKESVEEFKKDVEKKEKHSGTKLKNRMKYNRGGGYAVNGYFHLTKDDGRRKVYEVDAQTLGDRLEAAGINPRQRSMTRQQQAQLYTFAHKPSPAENNWLSSSRPYRYQAHHLVPDEMLKKAKFTEDQWVQLVKVPYNINHGENIMLLPESLRYCGLHKLPKHNGSHPAYNALVESDINKLKNHLKNTDCDNPEPPPMAVLTDLIQYQGAYWQILLDEGMVTACTVNQAAQAFQARGTSFD
jgi:hypothetical protein